VNRMSDADAARWQAARTLADLGELMALWLEGKLGSRPAYAAGCGPNDETAELVPVLAAANRAGFLTQVSQPGMAGAGYDGAWREQRAGVMGLATQATTEHIRSVAAGSGITLITWDPHADWRVPGVEGELATRHDGQPGIRFGAAGVGCQLFTECHPDAVRAMRSAWQVTLIDPEWGRNNRLWPLLARIAGQPGVTVPGSTKTAAANNCIAVGVTPVMLARRTCSAAVSPLSSRSSYCPGPHSPHPHGAAV
jgi:hypothetical protein